MTSVGRKHQIREENFMKVIANVCLVPIGAGVSVSKYVAVFNA